MYSTHCIFKIILTVGECDELDIDFKTCLFSEKKDNLLTKIYDRYRYLVSNIK